MRKGQLVHFHARLRPGQHVAFCEVYCSVGGYEPSPFIPASKLDLLQDGKPRFLQPTTLRLSEHSPDRSITIVADEDCRFYLMQDVDVKGDPRVKGRITTDGTIFQKLLVFAFGWLSRNR